MQTIIVKNLSRDFTYYTKEEGFKNSLKDLFFRKSLVKKAVQEISFSIDEGEMVGFLGPNGAGKSTTLKMLSGILYPSCGNANILGYTPWKRDDNFKKQIAIVMGQKNQLWWDLPANESINLNKYIYEIDDREFKKTVDELSEMLDVKELLKVQVRRLSLGERMKVELVAALVNKPKVLFLDEPTIGLDIISQVNIRSFLKYYNEQTKATVILTSHYLKDIEDTCKRCIFINQGKIVYDGDLNKVNETLNSVKLIKIQMRKQISKNELENFGDIREYDGVSATIAVNKKNLTAVSKEILNYDIDDFNVEEVPIEDSIAFLYKKAESK